MSEIPAKVEDIIRESFDVKDVTYFRDRLELVAEAPPPHDSDWRFRKVFQQLKPLGFMPKLRYEDGNLRITVSRTPSEPRIGSRTRNILLMVSVAFIVLTGYLAAYGRSLLLTELSRSSNLLLDTLAMSIGLLTFLYAHLEIHRRSGDHDRFVPLPSPPPPLGFGTFGDMLWGDSRSLNRAEESLSSLRALGAGALIGLLLGILGLITSDIIPSEVARAWMEEGKVAFVPTPLILLLLEMIMRPNEGHLLLSPLALASVMILTVTFLISLPVQMFDGGRVIMALVGSEKARRVGWLAVFYVILFNPFLGLIMLITHSTPADIEPLDSYSEVPPHVKKKVAMAYTLLIVMTFPFPAPG